jgi:DNA topoisomerase-1
MEREIAGSVHVRTLADDGGAFTVATESTHIPFRPFGNLAVSDVLTNVMSDTSLNAKNVALRSRSSLSAGEKLAKNLGLRLTAADDLTITRRVNGRGFAYSYRDGRSVRDRALIGRLNRLAVPPAYVDAQYCPDPCGHLQAIWRDAAGRLQYRYHPDWDQVRAQRRMRRLARLTQALPRIRRAITRCLASTKPDRELALAAVIELIALSGIRAGRESYARSSGTRGAATLLKSNVTINGEKIVLSFRAKGGKATRKQLQSRRLAGALSMLRKLPGRRMFQYRDGSSEVKTISAREANAFLRDLAGVAISLKDFRTLSATTAALDALTRTAPAGSAAGRRRQVRNAMQTVSEQLGNTPAICRKSYVPAPLLKTFENGRLRRQIGRQRRASNERLLAELLAKPDVASRPNPNLKIQLKRSVRRLRHSRAG